MPSAQLSIRRIIRQSLRSDLVRHIIVCPACADEECPDAEYLRRAVESIDHRIDSTAAAS